MTGRHRGRGVERDGWARLRRDDSGSTLLLTMGFGALSLAVVLVVVAATSLYLERKRLFTAADGAALASAEAFDLDRIEAADDGTVRAVLDPADVRSAAEDYLDALPGASFEALTIERADTVDGRTATVALSCRWSPPIASLFVPDGLRIDVTATARAVFTAAEQPVPGPVLVPVPEPAPVPMPDPGLEPVP